MNSKAVLILVCVTALALLAGCTHFQQTLIGDEQTYAPTKPENVQVFFSNATPTRPYKEVGFIVADKSDTVDAVNYIKEKAALMGADALVNCEIRVHTFVALFIIIPI